MKVLGAEHPSTLASVGNMGWVLRDQGKYEEAEEMLNKDISTGRSVASVRRDSLRLPSFQSCASSVHSVPHAVCILSISVPNKCTLEHKFYGLNSHVHPFQVGHNRLQSYPAESRGASSLPSEQT